MTEPASDPTPWQPPTAGEAEKKAAAPEPVEPRREVAGNQLPTREILITLLAPAAVFAAQSITIPGIDASRFEDAYGTLPEQLTIGAIGLTPFFSAFLLVELAAVIFPGWRNLRDGSIAGRAQLWRASVWLGLILVLLRSLIVFSNLRSLSWSGEPMLGEANAVQTLTIVSMLGGTSIALYVIAQIVDRHGLINGFAAMLMSAILISLIGIGLDIAGGKYYEASEILPALAAIGGISFLAATLFLGRRPWKNVSYRGVVVPRPASGEAPIGIAAAALVLPATLEGFGLELGLSESLKPGSVEYAIGSAVLVAAGILFFGWLFNRPEHVARHYPGASVADARAALRLSLFQTLVLLEVGVAVHSFWPNLLFSNFGFVQLLFTVVVVLDFVREWRIRSAIRDLVLVARDPRPHGAHAAIEMLEENDIPVLARAFYTRSLHQFFGPYMPIDLYVPAAHSERAGELLRDLRAQVREE